MSDRPGALALLRQARRSLLEELLPALPEERRYPALMVANALAIALREIESGEDPDERLLQDLAGLSASPRPAKLGAASLESLVAAIRAGAHDADERLHGLLLADQGRRLAVSNPKALAQPES